MKKRKILNVVRGEDDRLEISPVIRYVVNAEYLEHLLEEYRRLAAEAAAGGGQNSDADEEFADDNADDDD